MNISLITVCLNSEKYIQSTIESVLNQTYESIEYIIVDGLSNDNTLEIIRKYQPEFRNRMVLISEKDKGIYDAMNKGIRMAKGDIIGFLNSGDILIDKFVISDIVEVFKNKNVDSIYGNLYLVGSHKTDVVIRTWKGSPFINGSFLQGWHPPHPTFYVKRAVYEKYGGFDTTLNVSADFELMLRFLEKYHISTWYYDRFFVKMRYGGESTGSIFKIIKGNKNIVKAFKKNGFSISLLYPLYRLVPKLKQFVKR